MVEFRYELDKNPGSILSLLQKKAYKIFALIMTQIKLNNSDSIYSKNLYLSNQVNFSYVPCQTSTQNCDEVKQTYNITYEAIHTYVKEVGTAFWASTVGKVPRPGGCEHRQRHSLEIPPSRGL